MKNTKSIYISLTLILILIFSATSYSVSKRSQRERSINEVSEFNANFLEAKVAMKWLFSGTMSPYFAALENGIFKKHKLNIQLLEGGNSKPSIQQVIAGKAEFGITGSYELTLARANDLPLVSIAVIFKKSPVCMATKTEDGIRTPRDLVGKRVEITKGDNAEFEFRTMLELASVSPESLDIKKWAFNYEQFKANQVDASVVYANDQAISMKAQDINLSLLCPHEFGVDPYGDVLFTTQEMIDNSPELVKRVVFSFLESWEYASRNSEEVVEFFLESEEIKRKGFEKNIILGMLMKSLEFVQGSSDISSGGAIEGIGLQEDNKWQYSVNLLEKFGGESLKIPAVRDLYTNHWAKVYEYID